MNLYISLQDLGILILFLSGVTAIVILSIVLIRLNSLIGKITNIVDKNRGNIDKTMDQLPDTITNANTAISEVRATANSATGFIEGIGETVSESAASVEDTYGQFIDVFKSIVNIVMKVKEILKWVRDLTLTLFFLEPLVGLEPTVCSLRMSCFTSKPQRQMNYAKSCEIDKLNILKRSFIQFKIIWIKCNYVNT